MSVAGSVAASVRRDRSVLLGGLALVTGVAWLYLGSMESEMSGPAGCHIGVAAPSTLPWTAREFAMAVSMWSVMMLAMMLPVVSPWLFELTRATRQREPDPASFPEAGTFLLGYGTVWLAYSLLAAACQLLLQRAALLSPQWSATSATLAAILLLVAGIYQWTPLRDACMTHCRSPLGFFLLRWRDGRWGAFTMGLQHGLYCAGCCWALMALSFVFGVMNLFWMVFLTAFLLVEKVASAGRWLSRTAGVLLVAAAAWMLVRPR